MKSKETVTLTKFGGYTASRNHKSGKLVAAAHSVLDKANTLGFDGLLKKQKDAWDVIWQMSDIAIEGDVKGATGNTFQYISTESNLFRNRF